MSANACNPICQRSQTRTDVGYQSGSRNPTTTSSQAGTGQPNNGGYTRTSYGPLLVQGC